MQVAARRELETDLEPFKGLLLGLFFIAVGMGIDFAVVLAQPWTVAAVVIGFLTVKAVVLVVMARSMPVPLAEAPVFAILLAQGGEFGFVVLQAAQGANVVNVGSASLLTAAIAISMVLTPLLLLLTDHFIAPRLAARRSGPKLAEISEPQDAPIICGFGRYGQILGRVIVVAIDGIEQTLKVVDLAKEHFPQAVLVTRARNAQHWYQLHARGVEHIERETLDSALMSGRTVMEAMGWEPHAARTQALRFRRHSIELMKQMAPHQGDEKQLIAGAKQGRQQLEALWSREREEQQQATDRRTDGWAADAKEPARGDR